MRILSVTLLAIFLVQAMAFTPVLAADGDNMFYNGGFESEWGTALAPAPILSADNPAIPSRDPDVKHSGDYSLKCIMPDKNKIVRFPMNPSLTFTKGSYYDYSAWICTESTTPVQVKIRIQWKNAVTTEDESHIDIRPNKITASSGWVNVKGSIKVPEIAIIDSNARYITFFTDAACTVYIDDVSFSQQPSSEIVNAKLDLASLIQQAGNMANGVTQGVNPTEYLPETVEFLNSETSDAQIVYDNSAATEAEIKNAIERLSCAISSFSAVTDPADPIRYDPFGVYNSDGTRRILSLAESDKVTIKQRITLASGKSLPNVTFISSAYYDGKLIDTSLSQNTSIGNGESVVLNNCLDLSAVTDRQSILIKCFVWTSASEMMPLGSFPYGRKLDVVKKITKSGISDVAADGNYLYFGGYNKLYIADITNPSDPKIVSELTMPGSCRQLIVEDNIVYMTAREEGLYIIDVSNPLSPSILCQYDTVELATGIQLGGNLLYVTLRTYGVEIIDVTDPAKPTFLSIIKTDEGQSVDVGNGYIYVGDWNSGKLTTIDVTNPRKPLMVYQNTLDGFGDGVYIKNNYVYVSTGHHSRNMGAFENEGDPGYGKGHGLEIYSLTNPAKPEFVSRVKFPQFYRRGDDMWNVEVAGDYAYCADTYNGVFVVNIKNPQKPFIVGYYNYSGDRNFVAGITAVDDYIYAACYNSGLHVLYAKDIAEKCTRNVINDTIIPPKTVDTSTDYRVYNTDGQIWSVDFIDGYTLVAAGIEGLKVIKINPDSIETVNTIVWPGVPPKSVFYVDVQGDKMYLSEGANGFSIWQYKGNGQFEPLGRYYTNNMSSVRQGVAYEDGKHAIIQCGMKFFVLDISDSTKPVKLAEYAGGMVYGDQLCTNSIESGGVRYTCAINYPAGIRLFDLSKSGADINTGINIAPATSDFREGVVSVGDKFLITFRGSYRLADQHDTNLESKPAITYGGNMIGKPRVFGNGLYISDRATGNIQIVDITNINEPILLETINVGGNPGGIAVNNGALIVPCGNKGLLIYDDFINKLNLNVSASTFLPSN